MKTRKLADLEVSAIGLGCMGMTHAYGAPSEDAPMIELMHQAFDLGITLFDTAECYTGVREDGTTAYNEELVGKGLKGIRDQVALATKCGVTHTSHGLDCDARPEVIRASIEGSLRRLQTDHVDLYYLHRPDPKVPVEVVAETMAELIAEGKILRWGVSEHSVDDIRRAHKICPLTVVQSRYAMIYREHESDGVLDACEELGIGYVAYSPLGNGFLSAAYDKDSTFEQGVDYRSFLAAYKPEEQDRARPLSNLVRAIAEAHSATSAQVALAWTMRKPFVVPIPGTRKLHRLQENAGSVDLELTQDELRVIEECLDQLGY